MFIVIDLTIVRSRERHVTCRSSGAYTFFILQQGYKHLAPPEQDPNVVEIKTLEVA